MKYQRLTTAFMFVILCSLGLVSFALAAGSGLDRSGIAQALGRNGDVLGDTYKVSFPRSDLYVKIGALTIKPALSLVSWAAFKKSADASICYGDVALLEDEVNPVISKLEEKGIGISAIHNHLLRENPRIMYLHFTGYGNEVELAKALREALALTKTPFKTSAAGDEVKPATAAKIEEILGYKGSMAGGVFHIVVPRNDIKVTMMGVPVPGSMGMNTPLNFQIEDEKAAINGDFMLLANEVNPVIEALRLNGIEIVSLHNHMINETPRLYFMHFWAYGDAEALAKGLKAALDRTAAGR